MKLETSFVIRDLIGDDRPGLKAQRERIYKLLCSNRRTNKSRAQGILPFLEDFGATALASGEPLDDVATDFLTNALHLFTELGLDVDQLMRRATDHHSAERSVTKSTQLVSNP